MIVIENGEWLYNEYGPSLLVLGKYVQCRITVIDKDQTKQREDILLAHFSITAKLFRSSVKSRATLTLITQSRPHNLNLILEVSNHAMSAESSFPTSISSLLLPSASQSFSSTLSSLKRSTLCTTNRLHSIHHDSLFVQNVASSYNLPLIANERCGSWYIPPKQKAGSAYFKSTDGHWGQWSLSKRRLNVQILDIIGKSGGFVTDYHTTSYTRLWEFPLMGTIDALLSTLHEEAKACLMH